MIKYIHSTCILKRDRKLDKPFGFYTRGHSYKLIISFQVQARRLTNFSTTKHNLDSVLQFARYFRARQVSSIKLKVYQHHKVVVRWATTVSNFRVRKETERMTERNIISTFEPGLMHATNSWIPARQRRLVARELSVPRKKVEVCLRVKVFYP